MKYFAFLFLMFASCNIFAQANAEEGEIIFIRGGTLGWAERYSIFSDGQRIAKIGNRRFFKYKVKAGTHQLSLQRRGKFQRRNAIIVPVIVEAGKTKYVLVVPEQGWWNVRFLLAEISEMSSRNFFYKLKETKTKS